MEMDMEKFKQTLIKLIETEKTVKYREVLEEVLVNLRSIETPNEADEYIDDSIQLITEILKLQEEE